MSILEGQWVALTHGIGTQSSMATVSLSSLSGLGNNTRLCKLHTGKGHNFGLQTFPMHWPVQWSELMYTWVNSTVKNSSVLETERNVRVLTDRWRGDTYTKSTETGQRGVSYRWASAMWRANCLMGSKCGNRNKSGELPHDRKSRPFFPWSDRELDSNTQNKEWLDMKGWLSPTVTGYVPSCWRCGGCLQPEVSKAWPAIQGPQAAKSTKTEVGWKQLEVEKIEI